MTTLEATVDLLHLFGDATRVRLMALLEGEELTVAELTSITGLSQSRVSTHVGRLREAGLLHVRRAGASTYYSVSPDAMPAEAKRMWGLLKNQVSDVVLEADRERRLATIQSRQGGVSWPESVAGEMERHYSPGRTWESFARGVFGFLDLGEVLDVGSGDGPMAELLAPRAKRIVCLDKSERMISAARRRLEKFLHAACVLGDMHDLPFDESSFDEVALFNVLTYSEQPKRVLSEAARVLRPGGKLALVTLDEHPHLEVAGRYGHVQAGFSPFWLSHELEQLGLVVDSCDVATRERRKPNFEVVMAFARKRTNGNGARRLKNPKKRK